MNKDEPWRVGVLFAQTGPTALIETALLNGTNLAVEQINAAGGVHGRSIETIAPDPGRYEDNYGVLARKLVSEDGISIFFGGYTSISRKALIPAIEQTSSLLFYPTFYEGFEYSDHVFYFGSCPNQYTIQLVDFMMREVGSSFYLIGANYAFPRESNRIIKDLLREKSGTLVAEKYLELDSSTRRAEAIVRDVEKRKPDVIFSTLVGDQVLDFYSSYHKTNLRKSGVPIASIVTSETEIDEMGAAVAEGHYCVANYFSSLTSPESVQFVRNYKARFGPDQRPSSLAESAYNQVMVFAKALQLSGTMAIDTLRRAVLSTSYEAPQGPIKMNAENHHTHLWSRIGVIDSKGEIRSVSTSKGSIAPDPYLITHEFGSWSSEAETSRSLPVSAKKVEAT